MTTPPPPDDSFAAPPVYAVPPIAQGAVPPAYSQQAYPPPAYGAQPTGFAQYSGYLPAMRTNPSATVAFVLALLGFVLTPIVDVAAVIIGHYALRTIRRTGEAGAGLAKAALGVGYSLIALGTLGAAFIVGDIAGSLAF